MIELFKYKNGYAFTQTVENMIQSYTECLKCKETRIEVAPYASFRYTKISLL